MAIGRNNKLLFRFKREMEFFKQTTLGNIVLMGYNTYISLPHKPLVGRLNFVLTRKTELYNIPIKNEFNQETTYFMSYDIFNTIYDNWVEKPIVFVIGGSQIYDLFVHKSDKIYITDICKADGKEVIFEEGKEPDAFFNLPSKFELKTSSELHLSDNGLYSYRFLCYQ
jgi:dihydrofolate reductase